MKFADFEPLNAAEQKLLKCSVSGEDAVVSKTRPDKPITTGDNANTVRASFIHWLALGGDDTHPLHAHGVQLIGAWIEDKLDLQAADLKGNLGLIYCHIAKAPNMRGIQLNGSLNLQGSCLVAGIDADSAQIKGLVFLRSDANHRFESTGTVRLLNASIGGNLECGGAHLQSKAGQDTISVDGAHIHGSVFLRSDAIHRFESKGRVRLTSASIGGNLDCSGAHLQPGAGQYALNADGTQIQGGVFLRGDSNHRFESTGTVRFVGARVNGGLLLLPHYDSTAGDKPSITLDVSHCTVGFLHSDAAAWADGLVLDSFVYGSLRGADWQTKDYLAWLKKQRPDHYGLKEKSQHFKPQPWQQLISVLRNMGHSHIANEVAIAFEKQRYDIGIIKGKARYLHWAFGKLAGYGYRPLLLIKMMLIVWLSTAMFYWVAAYQGVFAPSDPLVFQNTEYETCRTINTNGKYDRSVINNTIEDSRNWYTCAALKGEYTTFSPLAYSLDAILPLVDLGQEKTWGVYIETPKANAIGEFFQFPLNHWIRLLVWFEILFGWMASLILVAVLTGLTDRTKPK